MMMMMIVVNSLSLITWNWDIGFGRISQIEAMKTEFPQNQFRRSSARLKNDVFLARTCQIIMTFPFPSNIHYFVCN